MLTVNLNLPQQGPALQSGWRVPVEERYSLRGISGAPPVYRGTKSSRMAGMRLSDAESAFRYG